MKTRTKQFFSEDVDVEINHWLDRMPPLEIESIQIAAVVKAKDDFPKFYVIALVLYHIIED